MVWSSAGLLAIATFGLRFLTLRKFQNDHYMHLAWAQQMLLGEVPGRDFVEPGMPLTVWLSAAAQWISAGPLSEAILTIGMLSVATAATFVAATRLCHSMVAGVCAALFQMLIQPRLYSYPKILVASVAILAAQCYANRPSTTRAAMLGLWAACAWLLRHDLGLHAAAGLLACVWLGSYRRGSARAHLGAFAAAACVLVGPYVTFVTMTEGFAHDLREGIQFSNGERHQLVAEQPLPEFFTCVLGHEACSWSRQDSGRYLFWLSRLLVPVSAALWILRRRTLATDTRDALLAAIVLVAGYSTVILRHPVTVRVADVAPPVAIIAAWICTDLLASVRSRLPRGSSALVPAIASAGALAAMALAGSSVYVLAAVQEQVLSTGVFHGFAKLREASDEVFDRASVWPWHRFWPAGDLPPVVEYLTSCTEPTDRVLLTWSAPEYYYFSRRGFAGGHALYIAPRGFMDPADDRQMLERLERQSVPVVLINETQRAEFAAWYAGVDAFLSRAFDPVGQFTTRDGSSITIAVRKDAQARSTYEPFGWPCGFSGIGQAALN